jgi:hypothetical protein
MVWTLEPLIELPTPDGVPYPSDWSDEAQCTAWQDARADALAVPRTSLVGAVHARIEELPPEAWHRLAGAVDDDDDDGASLTRLDGGLGLFADERPILLPGCCTSLDHAIGEWEGLTSRPPDSWSMLWIGHPWCLVKAQGDVLMISTPIEDDGASGASAPEVLATMSLAELADSLDGARVRTERCVPRLAQVLRGSSDPEERARRALGLSPP